MKFWKIIGRKVSSTEWNRSIMHDNSYHPTDGTMIIVLRGVNVQQASVIEHQITKAERKYRK